MCATCQLEQKNHTDSEAEVELPDVQHEQTRVKEDVSAPEKEPTLVKDAGAAALETEIQLVLAHEDENPCLFHAGVGEDGL